MGHFIRNTKTFNAFIDRLVTLGESTTTETEANEQLNNNSLESLSSLLTGIKSDKSY